MGLLAYYTRRRGSRYQDSHWISRQAFLAMQQTCMIRSRTPRSISASSSIIELLKSLLIHWRCHHKYMHKWAMRNRHADQKHQLGIFIFLSNFMTDMPIAITSNPIAANPEKQRNKGYADADATSFPYPCYPCPECIPKMIENWTGKCWFESLSENECSFCCVGEKNSRSSCCSGVLWYALW